MSGRIATVSHALEFRRGLARQIRLGCAHPVLLNILQQELELPADFLRLFANFVLSDAISIGRGLQIGVRAKGCRSGQNSGPLEQSEVSSLSGVSGLILAEWN